MTQIKPQFLPLLFLTASLFSIPLNAQTPLFVSGKVTDNEAKVVSMVSVSVPGTSVGTLTDKAGRYALTIPAEVNGELSFSRTGYKRQNFSLALLRKQANGGELQKDVSLEIAVSQLADVTITGDRTRSENLIRLDPRIVEHLPSITGGGIENLLKTIPGVSSNNELSSQYSVRGGNFDENLVYVNDIQIYRPFLIRSGQQEGLSFINKSLVSSVVFSSGGFSAKYGDKMASVLDVKYRKPNSTRHSAEMSLLGGAVHTEGTTKNQKFSYIAGFRHKSAGYILNSMETEGDYKPRFSDFQAYLTYTPKDNVEISLLGNLASNVYEFQPESRSTKFGTLQKAYDLYIDFAGQEIDKFTTATGGLTLKWSPNDHVIAKFIGSAYLSNEAETYDIQGRYNLNLLDRQMGDNLGDSVLNLGVGRYLDHARNFLHSQVLAFSHIGTYSEGEMNFQWGMRYQTEFIHDQISQWQLLDSAGFSIPYDDREVTLAENVRRTHELVNERYEIYFNYLQKLYGNYGQWNYRIGVRSSLWSYNSELTLSPRASVSFKPYWDADWLFRFSAGWYHQPPFYKELRMPDGKLYDRASAQASRHYVLGADYNFMAWGRPFKFIAEAYYKNIMHLIPYQVDNVRLQYYPDLDAHGYVAGLDMKINGEFVEGVDSWFSLSFMKAEENIYDDGAGWIPRPTDQRINVGMFFQDYFPANDSYKIHLSAQYGSPLPFGPPNRPRKDATLSMPSYKRVDIGLSKVLLGKGPERSFLPFIDNLWLKAEVYNLFDIRNTVSYTWITVVPNSSTLQTDGFAQYAVPNRLTGRLLNLRLIAHF